MSVVGGNEDLRDYLVVTVDSDNGQIWESRKVYRDCRTLKHLLIRLANDEVERRETIATIRIERLPPANT